MKGKEAEHSRERQAIKEISKWKKSKEDKNTQKGEEMHI